MNPQPETAFIVGHFKSGSTWLCNLLSLHPDVRGLSETHVFRYAHESKSLADATKVMFTNVPWAEGGKRGLFKRRAGDLARMLRLRRPNPAADRPNTVLDMSFWQRRRLRSYLDAASSPTDYCRRFYDFQLDVFRPRRYLVDKTPTNIFEMERIEAAFPGAKYVAIYRDGRDVVVSEKYFRASEGWKPAQLQESIDCWRRAIDAQRKAAARYPLFTLRYEDLLRDPDHELTKLLDFLGLPCDPAILGRMQERSSFEYITGRKRGQEDKSKFYRKGIAGDWRNHFTREDMELFEERAGDLLVELGYERSADPATWGPKESVRRGLGAARTS